jgi:uncharacterized protein YjiS (DUF1127 family)
MNTTTTHTTDTSVASGTKTRHWIMEVFGAVARLIRHRQEAAGLLELSDHQLADIGLTRDDVRQALTTSPLHDPTNELARVAGRNR